MDKVSLSEKGEKVGRKETEQKRCMLKITTKTTLLWPREHVLLFWTKLKTVIHGRTFKDKVYFRNSYTVCIFKYTIKFVSDK